MSNLEKYKQSFIESLSIKKDLLNDKLKYQSVPEWDSIGHMTLIAALEESFSFTMETNDIVDFSSYAKGMKILKKYKIDI